MKIDLKGLDFETLICEHNPFGMKEPDGKVCIFQDYSQVYSETIRRLREKHPRGYVEMALFLHENCSAPIQYARQLVAQWRGLGYKGDPIQIRWNSEVDGRDNQLRLIMRCLHTLSGTSFKEDMFKIALEKSFNYDNR